MFRTLWLKVFVIALILSVSSIIEVDASGKVRVNGYYRKDGTYVRPHYRTKPDGNPYNNYSYPGNYNPNTRKITTGNSQTYLDRYYNRSKAHQTTPVWVSGYFRKDGTYVRPHYRTKPDGNPYNNYSYPRNYNPNTNTYSTGNPHTYLHRASSLSIVDVLIAAEKSVYTGPKTAGETLAELLRSDYNSSRLRNALAKQRLTHQKQLEDAKRRRIIQQNKIKKLYNEALSKGDYEKAMYYAVVIEDFSPKAFKELVRRASMQRKYRK